MTTTQTTTATPTTGKETVKMAIRNLFNQIDTLSAWLITNPKDNVIVTKDRMHVLLNVEGYAKVGHYPVLPSIFHSKHTADCVAAGFKATKGNGEALAWEVLSVRDFANTTIAEYAQRVNDLNSLFEIM